MMTTVIERPNQTKTEAPSGRLRRPESESSPDWFKAGAGKDVIQADLDELTLQRQRKLDVIADAESRLAHDRPALESKVTSASKRVHKIQRELETAR